MPGGAAVSGGQGQDLVAATVTEWGDALRDAISRENRARLESQLFDIQRRQSIAYECFYRFAPTLVSELLAAGLGPAEVGARMRRLLGRPYLMQVFELIVNPLLGREQHLLSGGEEAAGVARFDADELPVLASYVHELVRRYRGDERFGPTTGNEDRNLVLDEEDVARCAAAVAPVSAAEVAAAGRMVGEVGLHSVLLHGEHRDGIFDHGPYPGPDGSLLLVREINDLANDFLPWSPPPVRLSVSGLAVVYSYRDADLRFDLFGGVSVEEEAFAGRVERLGLIVRDADGTRAVGLADLERLVAEARAASAAVFAEVAAWEDSERVLYGAYLYANHLLPFARMLDEEAGSDRGRRLLDRFVAYGREFGAALLDRPLPSVARYQAEATGGAAPYFTPPTTDTGRDRA